MSKTDVLRVSEVYASVQGEGPRTGQTTVFLRFGGCNLRCPGWPCDTQHAIDPAFRSEWKKFSPEDLADWVVEIAKGAGARMVTFTGGEPFLQNHEALEKLAYILKPSYKLEAFTNGTIYYPEWATEEVSMIVDWKLPGSGEYTNFAGRRYGNLQKLDESSIWHSIKFVCRDLADIEAARQIYNGVPFGWRDSFKWYYGRVWDGLVTDAALAGYVMTHKLPWHLNVQLHNYIWHPQERGR